MYTMVRLVEHQGAMGQCQDSMDELIHHSVWLDE